jgi:hypothetical protein
MQPEGGPEEKGVGLQQDSSVEDLSDHVREVLERSVLADDTQAATTFEQTDFLPSFNQTKKTGNTI